MYFQNPPTVIWCSRSDPHTLVPVGTDALAMLTSNVVVFLNVKNELKSYYKGDNAQTSAGISLLAGHHRYPLFAIAETVLRPRIFVMRYPEMEKLVTIYPLEMLSYEDLVFSDFGYIAAMSGYPEYKISLWNYKDGAVIGSARTYKKSAQHCLYPIKTDVELVIQYAVWHRQIIIWQSCHVSEEPTLNEMATIDLNSDFAHSTTFQITYWDDACAYVVNDYGEIYWIDVSPMTLRLAWSTPERKCQKHCLFYNKIGLIVVNMENIFLIRRRAGDPPDFTLEWTLENFNYHIEKVVADHNNNIFGATSLGNIELVQYAQQVPSSKPVFLSNCIVVDYAILKGIKDEVVLLLTSEFDLRLVDVIRMNAYSNVRIDDACSIAVHNALPYVAVGTKGGMIHFLTYEKPRTPVLLGAAFVDKVPITMLRIFENSGFAVDEEYGVHIILNNFKESIFNVEISLQREIKNELYILDVCLLDEERAALFISDYVKFVIPHATEIWLYCLQPESRHVSCSRFKLPHKYRAFNVMQPCTLEAVEIMAIRLEDNVIDMLLLENNTSLSIAYSLKTCHLTYMSTISGTRHIVTTDTQSVVLHFRTHKKSKFTYHITRPLLCTYSSRIRVKSEECFNAKYLLVLYGDGCLLAYRLPLLIDNIRENELCADESVESIAPYSTMQKKSRQSSSPIRTNPTPKEIFDKEMLVQELHAIEQAMRALIDYDFSVAGQIDNYRKFCLDYMWLNLLIEESRILCEHERSVLLAAVADQSRIRDWIFDLIKSKSSFFSTKIRSMFANVFVENYTTRAPTQELLDRFDLYRFYNMEPIEEEIEEVPKEDGSEISGEEEEQVVEVKALKHYVLQKGESVYEHVMAKDFELQDINIVTFNQMYNEDAKITIFLTDALKAEFNKKFESCFGFKEEIIGSVINTNLVLQRIYANMNCMLCLLKMEQFTPPVLSVPEWTMDENIERILTVDDSEIKAINRRKKIVEAAVHISGRMLLWSLDFWKRALLVMMDGVLEKLWEEEIKKTPPPLEFMLKKPEHEFNLEEQKLFREYLKNLQLLEDDRKKYLRILRDNEGKAENVKKNFIMKFNEHVTEVNILKLKYDFAIKHERLRLLNTKLTDFKRIECRKRINDYKADVDKLVEYYGKFKELIDFYERSQEEYKANYENQLLRDRTLERQFKGQYLNSVPQHLTQDLTRIYRRRPKLPSKVFSTAGICFEMAKRVVVKKQQKFPLPQELLDFLALIDTLDDIINCPAQLDQRYWDHFIKLRRQKIESEIRLKGINYQVHDMPKNIAFVTEELRKLKETREEQSSALMLTVEQYFDTVHNQRLELMLTTGQVEINTVHGCLEVLENSVLMHVDDIIEVNRLIKEAGGKKLKAMQRVAHFRRKVIYKEWEHKVVRANIEYLEYILYLVERCKVTYEFLEVLRNWDRLKAMKETANRVGILEEITERKIEAARRNLNSLYLRIDETKQQLDEKRRSNLEINSTVDNFKVNVTYANVQRDYMGEEKAVRSKNLRMSKAIEHGNLMNTVHNDYAKILELQTILKIIGLRTNEALPPIVPDCIKY